MLHYPYHSLASGQPQVRNTAPSSVENRIKDLLSLALPTRTKRKWQSTPVFLPGKSHGWRSLVGYSLRGCKESDMTEQIHSLTITRPSFACSESLPLRSFHKSHPHPPEGKQNENHNHRKLTNLITWTTALSNSMKLWAMPCRANQDEQVMIKHDPLEKGMADDFSILALRTPWTVWKGKKIRTLKDELFRSVGVQYATGDQWRNNSRKNEDTKPKQ